MDAAMHSINSGAARILVGTQMVTKGHDFQNMTLVVVLNADQGSSAPTFARPSGSRRPSCRWPGAPDAAAVPGEVLIQTAYPDHPLLQTCMTEGYDGFARTALAERAAAAWPPFSRLAVVRASAKSAASALEFLTDCPPPRRCPHACQTAGPGARRDGAARGPLSFTAAAGKHGPPRAASPARRLAGAGRGAACGPPRALGSGRRSHRPVLR
jgi:primosomal protein N'